VVGERKGIRRPFVSPVVTSAKKVCLQDDKVSPTGHGASSSSRSLLLEKRQLQEKIKEQEVMLQQLKNADETEKVDCKFVVCILYSLYY